jgi:3-phosphoglycerate kinase
MISAQTIPELTNYTYNELCYNVAKPVITGSFVSEICNMLEKCDIKIKPTTSYDQTVADGIKKFQEMANLKNTGILNNETFQAMIIGISKMSDTIDDNNSEDTEESEIKSDSPHYNAYFSNDNYKIHRKNYKDIKISFGNNSIVKTIKNVFMRSVNVEVDTSGNPICEVYEFIAQDIIESDEIADIGKYSTEEDDTSLNITHDFSSIGQ